MWTQHEASTAALLFFSDDDCGKLRLQAAEEEGLSFCAKGQILRQYWMRLSCRGERRGGDLIGTAGAYWLIIHSI